MSRRGGLRRANYRGTCRTMAIVHRRCRQTHAYSLGRLPWNPAASPVLMSGYPRVDRVSATPPAAARAHGRPATWPARRRRHRETAGFGQLRPPNSTTAVKYGIGGQARPARQTTSPLPRQDSARSSSPADFPGLAQPRLAQPGLGRLRPASAERTGNQGPNLPRPRLDQAMTPASSPPTAPAMLHVSQDPELSCDIIGPPLGVYYCSARTATGGTGR